MSATTRAKPLFRGAPVDVVIDVRSKLEYWLGHLDRAACIPVDIIATELPKRADIAKNATILVYCASGARSAAAAAQLKSLGYSSVIDGGSATQAATRYTP